MHINTGFDLSVNEMTFISGDNVFCPEITQRKLNDVRKTLRDKNSNGPDILYSIAMDIGNFSDKEDLIKKNQLYGACIYNKGRIGNSPVHSQGHVHAVSASCNFSTPELYEILWGKAIIVMQECVSDDPKRVFAVKCDKGDIVIVPPGYGHYTLNANENDFMVFGAWCVRDYGFDYDDVRKHSGLSYYPVYNNNNEVEFEYNPNYKKREIIIKSPREYKEFSVQNNIPLYTQYENNRDIFDFVSNPKKYSKLWENFIP